MKISIIFSVLIILGSFTLGSAYYLCSNPWIDVSIFEHYDPGMPTILLDDQGNEWGRFELDQRSPIALEHLPDHVLEAFISAEDWYFYSHYGISWKGIFRSVLVNLYHRKRVQGASTITQQLVKLLFFDLKKTFSRKLKEQLYALIIEQQFSKQQILEIYINHVYFGCGIYGIEAAAQRFWGVSAAQLTIAQAATLAGIIKNPAAYSPLLHPEQSIKRRNVVLTSMLKREVISPEQYDGAVVQELALAEKASQQLAPHFKEHIRVFLEQRIGAKELYTGGYCVQTTLNQHLQKTAQHAFLNQITHLKKELQKDIDGGLISFEVQTGQIKALVGGADYKKSAFNRALQAKRQLGSIFKPIIYAAALEQGLNFWDVVIDEPIEIEQNSVRWTPHNFNRQFDGAMTRAYALSHSNNMISIKTLLDTGIMPIIKMAERCHIPGPFKPYPSLALGCTDGTLKDAAAMINIFAGNGAYIEPYGIQWIKDKWGKKIYKADPTRTQVMSNHIASQVAKVLLLGVQRLHKWFSNRWFDGEVMSKTGTTNECRSCWYIGSTPSLTTGVYVGCDDNRSMGKNIYPVNTAFPIWLEVTRVAAKPGARFTFDASLEPICIHERSGKKVAPLHEGAIEILAPIAAAFSNPPQKGKK
jgi:penicillin-binding protein 1A